jgi:type I restriction enzyme M protein
MAWWKNRGENDRAWRVPVEQIAVKGYNLDLKNPSAKDDLEHMPPEQLADDILKKEQRITEIMAEIKQTLARAG